MLTYFCVKSDDVLGNYVLARPTEVFTSKTRFVINARIDILIELNNFGKILKNDKSVYTRLFPYSESFMKSASELKGSYMQIERRRKKENVKNTCSLGSDVTLSLLAKLKKGLKRREARALTLEDEGRILAESFKKVYEDISLSETSKQEKLNRYYLDALKNNELGSYFLYNLDFDGRIYTTRNIDKVPNDLLAYLLEKYSFTPTPTRRTAPTRNQSNTQVSATTTTTTTTTESTTTTTTTTESTTTTTEDVLIINNPPSSAEVNDFIDIFDEADENNLFLNTDNDLDLSQEEEPLEEQTNEEVSKNNEESNLPEEEENQEQDIEESQMEESQDTVAKEQSENDGDSGNRNLAGTEGGEQSLTDSQMINILIDVTQTIRILRLSLDDITNIQRVNNICKTKYGEITFRDEVYVGYKQPATLKKLYVTPFCGTDSCLRLKLQNFPTKEGTDIYVQVDTNRYCSDLIIDYNILYCKGVSRYNDLCKFNVPSKTCEFEQIDTSDSIRKFNKESSLFKDNKLYVNKGSEIVRVNDSIELKPQKLQEGNVVEIKEYFLSVQEIDKYFDVSDETSFISIIEENKFPLPYKIYIFILTIIGSISLFYGLCRCGNHFLNYLLDKCIKHMRNQNRQLELEMEPLQNVI